MIGPSLMVLKREAGEEGGLHIEIRGATYNSHQDRRTYESFEYIY